MLIEITKSPENQYNIERTFQIFFGRTELSLQVISTTVLCRCAVVKKGAAALALRGYYYCFAQVLDGAVEVKEMGLNGTWMWDIR